MIKELQPRKPVRFAQHLIDLYGLDRLRAMGDAELTRYVTMMETEATNRINAGLPGGWREHRPPTPALLAEVRAIIEQGGA